MNDRKRGAILGAAVADAATLGFHWLYDQNRIRTVAPTTPEFRQPTAADYADVPGYFAHAHKSAGEFSQYGEQHQTMLRALSDNDGLYDKAKYETAFVECFGYGGSYWGYIDHPTRDTLNNIATAENNAIERASNLPFTGPDELKRKLITKVLGNAKQFTGDELKKNIEATVRLTDNEDYLVEHAFKMLNEWESVNGYHGADDTQLPALAKLPALVAAYTQHEELLAVVDSAVRVTNHNDTAAGYALGCAKIIEAAIVTGEAKLAIEAGMHEVTSGIAPFIEQALAVLDRSTPDVTAEWGMACQLTIGIPSAIHNIATSNSFTDAIRKNIYAGGDSCGRSILIGSVIGACYGAGTENGIPDQWIAKLRNLELVEKDLNRLLGVGG